MLKHCYFSCCDITQNGTFVLRVFTHKGLFGTEDYVFKLSSSEYDCFSSVLIQVKLWLDFLGLTFSASERSAFYRSVKNLFYGGFCL